jgi:hypothetical protein
MSPNKCEVALLAGVQKLYPILNPIGYRFAIEASDAASGGPFASGFYANDWLRIGLVYRSFYGLGSVIYATDEANASHDDVMMLLGHSEDQQTLYSDEKFLSYSRDAQDVFLAIAHDLEHFIVKPIVE